MMQINALPKPGYCCRTMCATARHMQTCIRFGLCSFSFLSFSLSFPLSTCSFFFYSAQIFFPLFPFYFYTLSCLHIIYTCCPLTG